MIKHNILQSIVIAKKVTCLARFVWKLLSRALLVLYVNIIDSYYTYKRVEPCFFLGDGRWRQVIRRCASVADTGVTGVCNWGVYDNGVYWEECYCVEDACNSSNILFQSIILPICTLFLVLCRLFLWWAWGF